MRFIGEVEDPMAAAIAGALQNVEVPRFWLTLAGLGQFGGHILWADVEPSPALLRLQNAVENELRGIGLAPETRPYLPHVKLAHSRRRRSFRPFLAEHAGFRAAPFEVRQFGLIESHRSSGTAYEHREDYVLLEIEPSL